MKLQYLGTAAAEGIPAIFCNCAVCTEARKRGGKNIRTRSQAIIDDTLLIDFPPDTYAHCIMHGLDLTKVKHCLITHTHGDHLYYNELTNRIPGYSNLGREEAFTLYGSEPTAKALRGYIYGHVADPSGVLEVVCLYKNKPVEIAGYKVTAVMARHDQNAGARNYIIEDKEGKTFFYGHDTGPFPDEVLDYLKENQIKLDYVSFDCTFGNNEPAYHKPQRGHMCLIDICETRDKLRANGNIDDNTILCCNHYSHNGKDVLYEEFQEIAAKEGFIISYDGMVVEF